MANTKTYEKAVVTFIDILGFRDLVKNSDCDKVSMVLDAVEQSTSPIKYDGMPETDDDSQVVSFSDSIVRVRKIETDANKQFASGILFQELLGLLYVQVELIDFDIIIRGGVSIGDVFISAGRVCRRYRQSPQN